MFAIQYSASEELTTLSRMEVIIAPIERKENTKKYLNSSICTTMRG